MDKPKQEIKSETIISVHYDERDRDYFAVVQDGSGESWVVNDAKNHQHAAAIVQSAYPSADVRLA